MSEENLPINPITQTMALRKLGIYCSERFSIEDYHLMQVVNLLKEEVGEEWIKKKYKEKGKNWEKIDLELKKLSKLLYKAKSFYDNIEDKSLRKKYNKDTIGSEILRFFKKTSSKIAIMQPILYELFVLLVKNTSIKKSKIPSDSYKVLEHIGMKKIPLPKKPTPSENSSS